MRKNPGAFHPSPFTLHPTTDEFRRKGQAVIEYTLLVLIIIAALLAGQRMFKALDERWEAWGDRELFGQDMKPSELFRRQCFVSVEPEEELAKYVVAELGDENLVLSTDWPHDDSRFPHAIDGFLGMPHLSKDSKRKILWDNCARLYKL